MLWFSNRKTVFIYPVDIFTLNYLLGKKEHESVFCPQLFCCWCFIQWLYPFAALNRYCCVDIVAVVVVAAVVFLWRPLQSPTHNFRLRLFTTIKIIGKMKMFFFFFFFLYSHSMKLNLIMSHINVLLLCVFFIDRSFVYRSNHNIKAVSQLARKRKKSWIGEITETNQLINYVFVLAPVQCFFHFFVCLFIANAFLFRSFSLSAMISVLFCLQCVFFVHSFHFAQL